MFVDFLWLKKKKGAKMSITNTNKKKDQAVFRHTAATPKAINVRPKPMRGGIRL